MLLLAAFVGFLKGLMLFFLILLALVLMLIVLLQEPKGGGLSAAFGGAGAETFGVQTGGVNKFTAWLAGIWMFLAILYAAIPEGGGVISDESIIDTSPTFSAAPAEPPPAEKPPEKKGG